MTDRDVAVDLFTRDPGALRFGYPGNSFAFVVDTDGNMEITGQATLPNLGNALYSVVALREALRPAGRYETISRIDAGNGGVVPTSGTLYLIPIWLPAGAVISNISFVSAGQAGASLTNQWFALLDSSRVLLALTADDTTTAWGANATKTLAISTTAAGAASSFTTTYSGLHYIGLMVAASTTPSVYSAGSPNTPMATAAPAYGAANTGQTTRPAFPFTAITPTGGGPNAYAYAA